MMKHSLYLIALVVVACAGVVPLVAQVSVGGTVYSHALSLSGDYPDDQTISTQLGYGVGAVVACRIAPEVEFTIEPSFDLRRGRITETLRPSTSVSAYDTTLATIRVSSLALPLGVRIWSHSQTWVFTSGIIMRLATHGTRMAGGGQETSLERDLANVEVGLYLGAGYRFNIGGLNVMPEIRYEQGISNVLRGTSVQGLPPAPIMRTNGFALRVACQYTLGSGQ